MSILVIVITRLAIALAACASVLAAASFGFLAWVTTMGAFNAPQTHVVSAAVAEVPTDNFDLAFARCTEAWTGSITPGADGFTC